jgi:signal transduction histidine kinase
MESKSVSKEFIYTRNKSGAKRIVKSDYFFDKNVQSQTIYGVAIVRDLTERVQLEEKIRHFEQLSTIGKFAAELAHEIRNPITGISCNAQFLYEEADIPKSHRPIIKEIVKSANTIETTLQKFLNLAHPPEPSLSEVNLNELISETISVFTKKVNKMGIKLDLALDSRIPCVNLDYELTKQVVINVLMNSMEAMEHGGMIRIETSALQSGTASGKCNSEYVQLRICDTGCGIAPDELGKIFDPFFTTKKAGSGLGLYISYKAVKDQGGVMEVRSEEGKGTETIIQFKLI